MRTQGINLTLDPSIDDGFLSEETLDDLVMIANAFVHPAAANEKRIEFNNNCKSAVRRF